MRDRNTAPSTPPGPSDRPRYTDIAGRTLPGGIRVLGVLGSTADGALYHAEYPTGLEVVLLLAAPDRTEANAARRARLERAIRIGHVNVAGIYEVGELGDGSLYVVLEKVSGDPLSSLLATRRRFPLPEALDLALQVAAGLRAAHRTGFVHGSLSPDTILVAGQGLGRARVKLIRFEFGTALRQEGAALPLRPEAAGYASPERLAGHAPDEGSDVYSLGAVLHHLLVGVPPDLGKVDGAAPRLARAVLQTALAASPGRRFQAISEFEAALERLAAVTRKPKRLNRPRARTLGVVGAALLLLLAGVSLLSSPEVPPATEHRPASPGAVPSSEADEPAPPAAPARSPPPGAVLRGDTLRARGGPPRARSRPQPRVAPPRNGPISPLGPDPDQPMETGSVQPASPREALLPTIEDRAQIYFRIGLDEALRQLGRPAHGIEGMSPLFHGLAVGRSPPFTDATRPVVRSVYIGPNESLVLLDQQRIRPGTRVSAPMNGRRIGDVLLHLHGEARPEVLTSLLKRVR